MKWLFRACLLVSLAVSETSCAPTKGYPGPELPDEQLSIIYTSYDANSIAIGEAAMNGIEFGSSGIKVLPGAQDFEMEIAVKQPPHHCYSYPDFDHYGYNECLKKASKKYQACDCWDYLSVYQNCYREVHDGTCRGTVNTVAGRQYDIRPVKHENTAKLSITERGTYKPSGDGTCSTDSNGRTETENSYIGSGRYTASSNGIYGCYGD